MFNNSNYNNKTYFWVLGTMIGIFIGSIQSSSRNCFNHLISSKILTHSFGIYAMSGKVTNFLGPFASSNLYRNF